MKRHLIPKLIFYSSIILLFTVCRKEIDGTQSQSSLKFLSGGNSDKVSKIEKTKDGGFIYCGSTVGPFNDKNAFMMKVDSNGKKEWYKTYGGQNFDIFEHAIECADGGFIAVGQTNSIGKGSTNGNNILLDYVLKTNSKGDIEWQNSYIPFASGEGILLSVVESKDHHYYATGGIYDSTTKNPGIFLIKLDAVGNLAAPLAFFNDFKNYKPVPNLTPTFYEYGCHISFSDDGSLLIGGVMSYDSFPTTPPSTRYYQKNNLLNYLLSVDVTNFKTLNFFQYFNQFIRTSFYLNGTQRIPNIKVISSPDGYFIGTFFPRIPTQVNMQLIKTDLNGNFLWEKKYSGLGQAVFYDMQKLPDESLLLIGASTSSALDFTFPEFFTNLNTMVVNVSKDDGHEIFTGYSDIMPNANSDILKCAYQKPDGSFAAAGFSCISEEGFDKMFWTLLNKKGEPLKK